MIAHYKQVKQHLQNKGDELQLYPFDKNGFLALVYVGMAHTQAHSVCTNGFYTV